MKQINNQQLIVQLKQNVMSTNYQRAHAQYSEHCTLQQIIKQNVLMYINL